MYFVPYLCFNLMCDQAKILSETIKIKHGTVIARAEDELDQGCADI